MAAGQTWLALTQEELEAEFKTATLEVQRAEFELRCKVNRVKRLVEFAYAHGSDACAVPADQSSQT